MSTELIVNLTTVEVVIEDDQIIVVETGIRGPAGPSNVITESSGPTALAVGAVSDGQFLKRAGSSIVGATPPGGGGIDVGNGTNLELLIVNAAGTTAGRAGYTIATLLAAAWARASHTGTQLWATISDGPAGALAAVTWSTITGKPSTFAPSVHASSHASAGSDPITPAAIGAEVAGTAAAAIVTHVGVADPHTQYALESTIGVAGGLAPLDGSGKIATSYLPTSVLGQVEYKAAWDATSGAPTLSPEKGWYYVVSVAGSTNLDGITDWKLGDWAIYNGTAWEKVDNTDAIASVAGLTGTITAAGLKTALAIVAADISDFVANVRSTVLTGLSTAAATVVTASHTVLEAIGFLQAQVTAAATALAANVRATVLAGLSTAAGTVVTASHTVLEAIGFLQNQVTARVTKATFTTKGDIIAATAADTPARLPVGATNGMILEAASGEATGLRYALPITSLIVACSDETTALTASVGKVTFRMPYAFTLTAVRASLVTAQTSGGVVTVDINEGGSTILSTKLTFDNTEKTTTSAATPAVISDAALADDAEITVDIDSLGDGTAKGLKISLIGYRTP